MKKFRTTSESIQCFHVLKETDKTVTFASIGFDGKTKQTTEYKRSGWQNWHDSFDDAKKFLIDSINADIKIIELKMNRLEEKLQRVNDLT